MPDTNPPDSKQQERQGGKQSSTAGLMPSKAKASGKEAKVLAQPVEQSLAARRAKSVYTTMERLAQEALALAASTTLSCRHCMASNLPAWYHTVLSQRQHDIVKHSAGCCYRKFKESCMRTAHSYKSY